jgi:hypothetical protein
MDLGSRQFLFPRIQSKFIYNQGLFSLRCLYYENGMKISRNVHTTSSFVISQNSQNTQFYQIVGHLDDLSSNESPSADKLKTKSSHLVNVKNVKLVHEYWSRIEGRSLHWFSRTDNRSGCSHPPWWSRVIDFSLIMVIFASVWVHIEDNIISGSITSVGNYGGARYVSWPAIQIREFFEACITVLLCLEMKAF